MYDSLSNIFRLILNNIIVPLKNALNDTNIFKPLLDFSNGILNNLMRLWNDNNTFQVSINNELISFLFMSSSFLPPLFIIKTIDIFFYCFKSSKNNLKYSVCNFKYYH